LYQNLVKLRTKPSTQSHPISFSSKLTAMLYICAKNILRTPANWICYNSLLSTSKRVSNLSRTLVSEMRMLQNTRKLAFVVCQTICYNHHFNVSCCQSTVTWEPTQNASLQMWNWPPEHATILTNANISTLKRNGYPSKERLISFPSNQQLDLHAYSCTTVQENRILGAQQEKFALVIHLTLQCRSGLDSRQ